MRLDRILPTSTLLLGLIPLLGWLVDIPALTHVIPSAVSMKANTASGFCLLGVALLLGPGRERMRYAVLLLVAGVGAITLAEYVAASTWAGLDELLVADRHTPIGTAYPGRMSVNTALAFCLMSTGMLLERFPALHAAATGLAGAIGWTGLIGYSYGVVVLYGLPGSTEMAIHTSAGFLLSACAAMQQGPSSWGLGQGWSSPVGHAARVLMLSAALIPVGAGLLLRLLAGLLAVDFAPLVPVAVMATALFQVVLVLVGALWLREVSRA